MGLKDVIKNRRIELGLTQEDVARFVRVSDATVSRWESGHIENMGVTRIQRLAEVLQLSPSQIMGRDDDNKNHAPTARNGKILGERIRTAREHAGFTQGDVARAVGVTKQTIFKYEVGIIENIPLENIRKIAALLGVSPLYITGWSEDDESTPGTSDVTDFHEENETRKVFAENLSRLIENRGIEQQKLARDLDVSTSIVSSWVLGKRFPRANMMQQIADYFHVTVSALVEAKPDDSPKLKILFSRSRALTDTQLDLVNKIVEEMTKEQFPDD